MAAGPNRPNILLILADDLGYGDVQCYYPAGKIQTPNLDRLAQQGMRFLDAHSPSAVCTPTRYGILTGRYAWRSRLKKGVLDGYSRHLLEAGQFTLPQMLRNAGYTTAAVGKWHLGFQEHNPDLPNPKQPVDYSQPLLPGPLSVGFDYFFGIPASLDMDPYLYVRNTAVVQPATVPIPASKRVWDGGAGYWRAGLKAADFTHVGVMPTLIQECVQFIQQQNKSSTIDSAHSGTATAAAGQPFFLYVPLTGPHTPHVPTPEYRGKSPVGAYGDFVQQCDAQIGEILNALEQSGQAEQTLVILTSDNGAHWPEPMVAKFAGHRGNGTWRGMKADIYEAGHRIPLLVRWPGQVAPGTVATQLVGLQDIMATVAEILELPLPDKAAEDSVSFRAVLKGAPTSVRDHLIHHAADGTFAIRAEEWKLVVDNLGSGGFTNPKVVQPKPGGPQGQLYNLNDDPGEQHNVYQDHPDVVQRLQTKLDQIRHSSSSR